MKIRNLLWLLIIVAGFVPAGCGNMQEPDFRNIDNVYLGQVGTRQSTVHLNVHYYNPNKSRIILKKADGDAWLDGVFLGKFNVDTLIRIEPISEFSVPVLLNLDMSNFLINSAVVYLDKAVLVKIEGKARVGKSGFFINYPIHFEGKQNLKELLKQ